MPQVEFSGRPFLRSRAIRCIFCSIKPQKDVASIPGAKALKVQLANINSEETIFSTVPLLSFSEVLPLMVNDQSLSVFECVQQQCTFRPES